MVLRRDPLGHTWLPRPLRDMVEADDECRAELRRFVEVELELFDEADAGPDPFFTARVLQSLPPPTEAVPPWRRAAILVTFQTLGIVAAYATAWIAAPAELMGLVDEAHLWVDEGWLISGPWAMAALALVGLVGFVALAAPRPHTPAA